MKQQIKIIQRSGSRNTAAVESMQTTLDEYAKNNSIIVHGMTQHEGLITVLIELFGLPKNTVSTMDVRRLEKDVETWKQTAKDWEITAKSGIKKLDKIRADSMYIFKTTILPESKLKALKDLIDKNTLLYPPEEESIKEKG